jgi:L-ascorbate metabolism protein UlaG (beta-lactamase superfamily)
MQLTYYGHSCFLIETNGCRLLFDPFITPNEKASHISPDDIRADFIFVSHGHEDHIADCIRIATRKNAPVITSWEIAAWLNKNGVTNTIPMNTGGSKKFDDFKVKCVVAQHSSSLPDGSYGGNPMGFVIYGEKNIYYSGDTALTLDMQLVPGNGPISSCILPIGDHFTMGYEDAAKAAHLIQCNTVIGVHYDTFPYIEIDHQAAKKHFSSYGLTLLLPDVGETLDI